MLFISFYCLAKICVCVCVSVLCKIQALAQDLCLHFFKSPCFLLDLPSLQLLFRMIETRTDRYAVKRQKLFAMPISSHICFCSPHFFFGYSTY